MVSVGNAERSNGDTNNLIENIFPTPIQYHVFEHSQFHMIQEEIASVVESVEWTTPEDWGKCHKLTTDFTTSDDIIGDCEMESLRLAIDEQLLEYLSHLGRPMPSYSLESWLTRFDEGDFGHAHNHGGADVCGVYYFAGSGQGGELYFENPTIAASMKPAYQDVAKRWIHQPTVGKMILFPPYLVHGVKANPTNNVRISLAFNVIFDV